MIPLKRFDLLMLPLRRIEEKGHKILNYCGQSDVVLVSVVGQILAAQLGEPADKAREPWR